MYPNLTRGMCHLKNLAHEDGCVSAFIGDPTVFLLGGF